ncbi:MAG: hypothetical protein ABI600_16295 [Luteolibacter sp.]
MESEAPIGEKRLGFRRWSWLVPAVLVLPVLGFLLSNLWLATPWSCRWMAKKIERMTGLETRVGGATWSPWNGACIHAVELLQPAALRPAVPHPLATIQTIQLTPVWRAWLRGKYEVRSITLDSPKLTIPIELLSHLSGSQTQPTPPVAGGPLPPIAQVNPATAPPAPNPPPVAVAPLNIPPPPAIPPQPTGWLHLKNASFSIVSIGRKQPLFEISNTTGSLPIAGDPAQSVLKIDSVSFGENRTFSNLSATMDWKYPVLSLKPLELEFHGYKFLIASKIAALSGLPIQIEAQIPKQSLTAIRLPFDGQVQAGTIALNAGFRGLLVAPATWQGDLFAETITPSLTLAGHDAKFDKGSAAIVLRGGLISCVDARLIGDDLSLLGNATVLANGNAAGVIRLVAPPESVKAIVMHGFPNIKEPSLTPLSSPQRSAFDLEAFGNISNLFLRLGKDGPIVNLKPTAPQP